jgi:hypothetical protein
MAYPVAPQSKLERNMNKRDLAQYGITIEISKKSWRVIRFGHTVASGNIGKEYNARNNARKDALAAANHTFVLARIKGDTRHDAATWVQINQRMRSVWSRAMMDAMKNGSFVEKFMKPGSIIEVRDLDDIKIIRPDPQP